MLPQCDSGPTRVGGVVTGVSVMECSGLDPIAPIVKRC
jgi:hypothetical protein